MVQVQVPCTLLLQGSLNSTAEARDVHPWFYCLRLTFRAQSTWLSVSQRNWKWHFCIYLRLWDGHCPYLWFQLFMEGSGIEHLWTGRRVCNVNFKTVSLASFLFLSPKLAWDKNLSVFLQQFHWCSSEWLRWLLCDIGKTNPLILNCAGSTPYPALDTVEASWLAYSSLEQD